MRILFIGDSIVRGSTGVNWVKMIAGKHPGWQIENAGVDGETISKVRARLEERLSRDNAYDIIVINAGVNDILIPSFAKRGFFFRQSERYLSKKAYQPKDEPVEFERELMGCINMVRSYSTARIVFCTIACINEDLDTFICRKRMALNTLIRETAKRQHCSLADVGIYFDGYLRIHPTRNYSLNCYFNTLLLDKLCCKVAGMADVISSRRHLHLTIDGVHLNTQGAKIFHREVMREILREPV